ncbi:MAG: esterase, depolymerase family [Bacteroidetes bacterium]|nr:esterase, depolymerase family [Bacteroidota bacterium]MDF2452120.1 esterase, depolymerase family [Bacteroidota bacterium]
MTLISNIALAQDELIQIRPFGTNPGNLKLMFYDPGNITEKAPLVVVLHGCTQMAKSCAEQSGWNKLAKLHQFYVLYPEQLVLNNPENCFNWYRAADQSRDKGEPGSIMQMITHLKKNKNIDSTRIYIIGLSAGGAMSSIMMAVYPEVFDKGGVMAGGPYKSAESVMKAGQSMMGMVSKSPEDWGNLIREQNPEYKGSYPELVIFHGGIDPVVSTNNANQLIKQWVNIHQTDYEEDGHYDRFKNDEDIELTVYKNKKQEEVVRYYRIKGIGHTLPIDTGSCPTQGGKTGMFALNKGFHSTFWAASFFGLIKAPSIIVGETALKVKSTGLTYSVPFHEGSNYYWNMPAGMWITSGKHSHKITVDSDYQSGLIEVTETDKNDCRLEPCYLWVEVKE